MKKQKGGLVKICVFYLYIFVYVFFIFRDLAKIEQYNYAKN